MALFTDWVRRTGKLHWTNDDAEVGEWETVMSGVSVGLSEPIVYGIER